MSARPRPLIAALALAAATSLALTTAPASAAKPVHDWPHPDLQKAYDATVKYQSEQAAIDDGYVRTNDCVENPELGGMGYHYLNTKPEHFGTDPTKPAAVLYEKDHKTGKRKLVALEWVVRYTGQPRPVIFGRGFDGPDFIPPAGGDVYTLHAWIFKKNPKGVFTPFNPKVSCDCPPDEMPKP